MLSPRNPKTPVVLLAALLLASCAAVAPGPQKILPPADLLADCDTVRESVATNGDLVNTILAYRYALARCNLDKLALREWAKD